MNQVEIINQLKQEAKDPATGAVMHVFALRERARNQVTIGALMQRMEKEGFNFPNPKDKYSHVLRMLANLGFGQLVTDAKGNVKMLKGINATLQSIGKAACEDGKLDKWKPRNKYTKVSAPTPTIIPSPAPALKLVEEKPAAAPPTSKVTATLHLVVGQRTLDLTVPEDITAPELIQIMNKFKSG